MAAGYDGTIRIDTSIESKGFNAGIKSMMASLKGFAAAIGIAFSIATVLAFGQTAVAAASDLASALMGLQSVLDGQGRSFQTAQKFIESYTKDGLIPATNAIKSYQLLALRGYSDDQIAQTLTALKDSAAFGRRAGLSMGEAVQTASEGLKNENSILVDNAGVTKNVAKMWDDYAKSIGTTANNLTQAQKIEAEVAGIREETKFQTGDAAKVAATYAGKIQALTTSFNNLRVAIGDAIIPVLAQIIPHVKAVVDQLTVLFNTYAQMVQALFGYDPSANTAAAEAATQAAEEGAAAQDDLAQSTEDAQKAAKGSLAAFDELNVLQQKQDPALATPQTNEGNQDEAGGGIAPEILAQVEAFKEKMEAFLQPVTDALGRLKEALTPLGQTVWEGMKWAWDNILVPFGTWVMNEAVPVFLDLLAGGADLLNQVLIALQPLGLWLWENFLQPIAAWTGQAFLDALRWITERLNDISGWISGHSGDFQGFADGIVAALKPIADWVQNNVIGPLSAKFSGLIQALIPFAAWFAEYMWPRIQWALQMVGLGFKNAFTTVVSVVGTVVSTLVQIVGAIITILTGIITFLTGVFTGNWRKAWEGLVMIFQGIFEGIGAILRGVVNVVIDLINGMLRAVGDGINAMISSLNQLQFTIPDWVPNFGGQSWGLALSPVSISQIPHLATGAVVPAHSNMLAMIGEGSKREIVAPDDTIRQIVREELGNRQEEITVRFEGTLAQFVRELRPVIERENRRIGGNLITGGSTA